MTVAGTQARPGAESIQRSAGLRLLWLAVLALFLLVVVVASVIFGVRAVTLDDALAALTGQATTAEQAAAVARLPRTVLGLLAGASLAVVIGLAFFDISHPYATLLFAVIGAGTAAAFVYAVGSLGRGGATPLKLALAGAATSAACSSLVSAILLPRIRVMDSFRFWQIGGIGGATWDRVGLVAPFLLAGALICLLSARGLNSLALGDDVATGLGENVMRTRLVASVGAVILCGVTTAVCGPIAFVGLVVPHVCRLLVGTDHRWMLPFAGLAGACLLLGADTLGRVVTPNSEIDVGIITPFIGAPFFIWIVRRQKVREL